MEPCSVEGCTLNAMVRGLCFRHYVTERQQADCVVAEQAAPPQPVATPTLTHATAWGRRHPVAACAVDGCERRAVTQGWCALHYGRWDRTGDPTTLRSRPPKREPASCKVAGCDRAAIYSQSGYCGLHYMSWRKYGDPMLVAVARNGTAHIVRRDAVAIGDGATPHEAIPAEMERMIVARPDPPRDGVPCAVCHGSGIDGDYGCRACAGRGRRYGDVRDLLVAGQVAECAACNLVESGGIHGR